MAADLMERGTTPFHAPELPYAPHLMGMHRFNSGVFFLK
jgi:hypothetical protein